MHEYISNSTGLSREIITGKFKREILDVCKVVRNYVDNFKLENKDTFSVKLTGAEFMSEINKTSIERVLLELISNSLRHSGSKKSKKKVLLSDKMEDDQYTVIIKDNGDGVEPDNIGRIWEPGWQQKDVNSGASGLGLAICKQIVEAHGGKIYA